MTISPVLDAAGRRRSPATFPGYHAGRLPRNKGQQYPADPPAVEEIIAVMRQASDDRHGSRVRALIAVLGKGGRRREIGMDVWDWEQLTRWLTERVTLPVGPLSCVIDGPTRGRRGRAPRFASSSDASPSRPACAGASRLAAAT